MPFFRVQRAVIKDFSFQVVFECDKLSASFHPRNDIS